MILDNALMFTGTSNGASSGITNSAYCDRPTTGTQYSSNVIDLHIAVANLWAPTLAAQTGARDLGVGDDPALKLLIQVTTTFASGTNMNIALQGTTDDGSGGIYASGWASWWTSPTYLTAQLVQGARLYDMDLPRPPMNQKIPRFLRLAFVSTGTYDAGALMAAIVLDRSDQIYQGASNAILGGGYPGVTVAN